MFVPAAMTSTQMTSTGVLVGSVAGAVTSTSGSGSSGCGDCRFQVSDAPLHLRNIF